MKTNNISASERSGTRRIACAILACVSLLSPSLALAEPQSAATRGVEDLSAASPECIVRPRRAHRVAEYIENQDTPASALKPALTDELVRPAQFVTGTQSPADATEEAAPASASPPQSPEPPEEKIGSGDKPLKLAKKKERSSADAKRSRPSPEQSLRTIGGSLAVVIALVLGMALLFRKAQPKGAGALPLEVIEVLGRSSLTKGQNLQLVRIGGKLVLLCVTAHGSEPLTEITDGDEVERLSTLCRQSGPKSVSAAFRDVLAQIGSDNATGGFVGASAEAGGQTPKPTSWWQQQYS